MATNVSYRLIADLRVDSTLRVDCSAISGLATGAGTDHRCAVAFVRTWSGTERSVALTLKSPKLARTYTADLTSLLNGWPKHHSMLESFEAGVDCKTARVVAMTAHTEDCVEVELAWSLRDRPDLHAEATIALFGGD